MTSLREVEFIFEPQDEGGYHVYAPELPGLHTQGESLDEATENAREALELYVEGLREDGRTARRRSTEDRLGRRASARQSRPAQTP